MKVATNHYQSLSKDDLSLHLHPPTTGPLVCYGDGGTKSVAGECTAGVSTSVLMSSALCGPCTFPW